jgi:hypothetical protein
MTIHSNKLEVGSAIIYVYWLMIFLGLPGDLFHIWGFEAFYVENSNRILPALRQALINFGCM